MGAEEFAYALMAKAARDAVGRWPDFADRAGLSRGRTAEIDAVLNPGLAPGGRRTWPDGAGEVP